MATERHDKRTLFIRDSEQETNDHLDATLLDLRTRELEEAQRAYDQANESFMNSPSITNGSRREEARTNLELAKRAYKLHLDHMAEELLHDTEKTVKAVRRDENGAVIESEFRNISKEGK